MLYPIVLIEPLARNRAAVGLDMAHEANRLDGVMRAKNSGSAQISGPIVLVQDEGRTPGFLFFAPYYSDDDATGLAPDQRPLLGLVYAPFVVKNLMQGTLGVNQRQVSIRIRDNGTTVYDEVQPLDSANEKARLVKSAGMDLYGRRWQFDVIPTPEFIDAHTKPEPLIILSAGIGIVPLLYFLLVSMAKSNNRAYQLAANMTEECRQRTLVLEKTNKELEKFAYVASHDLRAPLRAINQLASIIMEDAGPDLPEQTLQDLNMLKGRVDRMGKLLTGLLEYSRIGSLARQPTEIDVANVVSSIIDSMEMTASISVDFAHPMAKLYLPEAIAELIFTNLLSNTVKHHDQPLAKVTISSSFSDGLGVVTYEDDGPGIAYEYRDKIFEMFQTLKPRDQIEASGMGLALVKKSLVAHGGRIELQQRPGRGASFRICWLRPMKNCR